ncbi:MAG: thioesterase family protein [Desulfobacteraceae bacterium]|nr:thioesterase family protein [Desulfobacteraceae bacterium]
MHPFDRDIANTPSDSPLTLAAQVSTDWSINGLPNGGFQMALLANAMQQQSAKKSMAIMTATFIARAAPGAARIELEPIAASSQFERFQARLLQPDPGNGNNPREKIRAVGTFVDFSAACTLNRKETGPPEVAPRSQCLAIPHMPKYTLFDQMDVLLDPACIGWMSGKLGEKSEHKGWIKFKQERAYDAASLLLIADSFPPSAFASQGMAAWVPTIEMSVNIRALPASPWLKCIFRTRFITCGLLEEDGELWDETGELVAISRQIAQFRG